MPINSAVILTEQSVEIKLGVQLGLKVQHRLFS